MLASLKPDAVYFLMFEGWKQELRSNRWHYATRWARHLPVVLLQPTQVVASRRLRERPEPRIPNTRILLVQSSREPSSYLEDTLVQLGQVMADMERHRVTRPILWFYNPHLAGLYAGLPAVARIVHATENYFHFDGVPNSFLDLHRFAIRLSDLVVAVSDGVAASIQTNVREARLIVATNGCDYTTYSRFVPDPKLVEAGRGFTRTAVYAGNINSRLDFVLLRACVPKLPETLFAFFGPVHALNDEDARLWDALRRERNVRYFGPADVDSLPGLYGAADVGVIPYKRTHLIVENGFPLKALEMCATGLPVVATLMKPLQGLTAGLVVARDDAEFATALHVTGRASLSEECRRDMRRLCERHDYDRKFEAVLAGLGQFCPIETRREPGLQAVIDGAPTGNYREHAAHAWRARAGLAGRVRSWARWSRRTRAAKCLAAARLAAVDGPVRALLWEYARDRQLWSEVSRSAVLADALRLIILAGAHAPFRAVGRYEPREERFVFRSLRGDGEGGATALSAERMTDRLELREIVWDHSAIGGAAPFSAGGVTWSVHLVPSGVYRFTALEALARRHPNAVWRALLSRRAASFE